MRELLDRHALLAIFIICFMEDVGIPMPLPADVLVVFVGYRIQQGTLNPWQVIPLILIAVNIAGTILYTIARRGGRPLIDRYGHFLHLNADRLARAEGWLTHRGMLGIVIGRALPGVRLATVISCGIFKVPLRVFLPAQMLGIIIYVFGFIMIGYWLGPKAVESIHLPTISVRLILLLILVIGLPFILRRINARTATDDTREIQDRLTRWQRISADLLAGFVGMIELTTIWDIVASLTNLMHREEIHRAALTIARWLDFDQLPNAVGIAYSLDYLAVTIVCTISGVFFFQWLMPRLRIGPHNLLLQTVALWLLMILLAVGVATIRILNHVVRRPAIETLWVSPSAGFVFGIILLGLLGYAYVACETRRLAIDRFSNDPNLAPSATEAIDYSTQPVRITNAAKKDPQEEK